jgi:hypothetical protein
MGESKLNAFIEKYALRNNKPNNKVSAWNNVSALCTIYGCHKKTTHFIVGLAVCHRHALSKVTTCCDCGEVLLRSFGYGITLCPKRDREWVCKRCLKKYYDTCPHCGNAKKAYELLCASCSSNPMISDTYEALDSLDRKMALVVMEYYSVLARELEDGGKLEFRATPEQVETIARYFITTVSAELRHAKSSANLDTSDYYCLTKLKEMDGGEISSARGKLMLAVSSYDDLGVYDTLIFLRSAYAVFRSGTWRSGFGGCMWGYCVWRAFLLLGELYNRNGYAPRLLWETCLNACHNNNRWLNKVGTHTLDVLTMGANASPKEILDIYYANDPIRYLSLYTKNISPLISVCEANDLKVMPPVEEIWTDEFCESYHPGYRAIPPTINSNERGRFDRLLRVSNE